MHHSFSTIGLYILSGPPASGKSTWAKNAINLPKEAIVSTDSLREQIFGARSYIDKSGSVKKVLASSGDAAVFEIARKIVEQRLKEKLVTVIDATNVTESERASWAQIAAENGVPSTVLFFHEPLSTLEKRDLSRDRQVGAGVIKSFNERRTTDTKQNHAFIKANDTSSFHPPTLPNDKVDVIGDIHGLYDDLLSFINTLGYSIDDKNIIQHPDNRKLLFLGDWIDRGPDSVKCMRLVHDSVVYGGHFAVPGNHEYKVTRGYNEWRKEKSIPKLPIAGMETLTKIWSEASNEEAEKWARWIKKLPPLYAYGRFIFCHADLMSCDVFQTPMSDLLYGESGFGDVDSDFLFSQWSEKTNGDNGPILIRGHIPPTNPDSTRAFSLERHVGFSGTVLSLPLDGTIKSIENGFSPLEAFNLHAKSHKTNFDFDTRKAYLQSISKPLKSYISNGSITSTTDSTYGLQIFHSPKITQFMTSDLKELHDLEAKKLVGHKTQSDGLSIYKYHRRVFFDNLWGEHELLMHARGLVLGPTGEIVQNPFVKVFNYGERGAGASIDDNTRVEAVEKLNGFLGCITRHPYDKTKLLVTTTGSFDSDFVGYIKDYITPAKEKLFQEHFDNNNQTLMFEVIHPKDPHIIEYKEKDQGLYLIGARGKGLKDPLISERDLDTLAKKLDVRRPKHYKTTFGSLRKRVETVQHEGYLVRSLNDGEPLLKFKSAHYLTVKFIGRMGPGMISMLFKNPQHFKSKVDEEYYPLVDLITDKTSLETFSAMASIERVDFVRGLVDQMWADIKLHGDVKDNKKTNRSKP
jgi:predicted kinase